MALLITINYADVPHKPLDPLAVMHAGLYINYGALQPVVHQIHTVQLDIVQNKK